MSSVPPQVAQWMFFPLVSVAAHWSYALDRPRFEAFCSYVWDSFDVVGQQSEDFKIIMKIIAWQDIAFIVAFFCCLWGAMLYMCWRMMCMVFVDGSERMQRYLGRLFYGCISVLVLLERLGALELGLYLLSLALDVQEAAIMRLCGAVTFPMCWLYSTARHIQRCKAAELRKEVKDREVRPRFAPLADVFALGGLFWSASLMPLALVRADPLAGFFAVLAIHIGLMGLSTMSTSRTGKQSAEGASQSPEFGSISTEYLNHVEKETEEKKKDSIGSGRRTGLKILWRASYHVAWAGFRIMVASLLVRLVAHRGSFEESNLEPVAVHIPLFGHLAYFSGIVVLASRYNNPNAPEEDTTFWSRQSVVTASIAAAYVLGYLYAIDSLKGTATLFMCLWMIEKQWEYQTVFSKYSMGSAGVNITFTYILLQYLYSSSVLVCETFSAKGLYLK